MENIIQEKVTQKDDKRFLSFIVSMYHVASCILNFRYIFQNGFDTFAVRLLVISAFFAVAFFIGKKDKLLILASGLYGVNMFIQYIPNITNPISIFSLVAVLLLVGLISVNCIPALKDKVHFTKKYFWLPTLMFFIIEIINVMEVFAENIENIICNFLNVIEFPIITLLIGIWVTSDTNDAEVTYNKKDIIIATILVVVYKCVMMFLNVIDDFVTGAIILVCIIVAIACLVFANKMWKKGKEDFQKCQQMPAEERVKDEKKDNVPMAFFFALVVGIIGVLFGSWTVGIILAVITFAVFLWGFNESSKEEADKIKKEAQQKAEQEAREKRREDFFVKVGEVNYKKGNELRHLFDDSVAIMNRMVRNILSRPLDLKPIYHDPILRGGLASGMAGTAAGVYTAIKTDEENRAAKNAYNSTQDRRMSIEREAYPIYKEFLSTERKMMDILKETLGENCGEFIDNYKSSLSKKSINLITDLCAEYYSKYQDENSRLCVNFVKDRIPHIKFIYEGVAWDKSGL